MRERMKHSKFEILEESHLVPFCVADRPASLRILKGSDIYHHNKVGIMGHANTTKNFQCLFSIYPCSTDDFCDVVNDICPYEKNIQKCPNGLKIREKTIKMCDSGVFTKGGCMMGGYEILFETYERMRTDYGIMIDVLKDKKNTLKSAESAIESYKSKDYDFRLVGVAQGKNIEEYLECYEKLKNLGFDYIAIGGLLVKNENSARYVRVRDEIFLLGVLKEVRKKYTDDWLFPLGCFHPKRRKDFEALNVWGSDYKGWIFNYKQKDQRIDEISDYLNKIELKIKLNSPELNQLKKEQEEVRRKLLKLKKERRKLHKNNENNEHRIEIKELFNKIKLNEKIKEDIDTRLLIARKEIIGDISNTDYASWIEELEDIIKMDAQVYRFSQIRNYLKDTVYFQADFERNLLLLGCSNQKFETENLIPAIERYNGVNYKVLKKLRRDKEFPYDLDIVVISAKYGFLKADIPIEYYNQPMTKERALELRSDILNDLKGYLKDRNYAEIFVNLGKTYLLAIKGFEEFVPKQTRIMYAEGKIGERMAKMKEWLFWINNKRNNYQK